MLVALALGLTCATAEGATVVAGVDHAVVLPPAGVVVRPYENDGYRLQVLPDGSARIEVSLAPVESRTPFAASAPSRRDPGAVASVARALTAGEHERYGAVEKILTWVGGNVAYDLDRAADQSPERVLERRAGYCTGIARLTVALLESVGIEAREVPGYVVESQSGGPPAGFHRWIEVFYPDRGWVFSDPVASHQFVPATYLRLDDDRLAETPGVGRLLARESEVREIDEWPGSDAAGTLRVRPNDGRRRAAALELRLAPALPAEATLEGEGIRRSIRLPDGRGVFLGLEPGRYQLRVEAAGHLAARKMLTFRDRVLAQLEVPMDDSRPESVTRR
jgi:hypothetical protein